MHLTEAHSVKPSGSHESDLGSRGGLCGLVAA